MEGSTSQISAPLAGGPLLGRISLPLFEAKTWLRFLGVVSILIAVALIMIFFIGTLGILGLFD